MRKVLFPLFIFSIFILGVWFTDANGFVYLVKKGDVFSKVVKRQLPGPVWGRKGNLNKVLKLNPQIRNPDLIFPGNEIQFEAAKAERIPASEEPLPPQKTEEKPAFKRGASLEIMPTFSFTSLSARDLGTGGRSTLASKLDLQADVSYVQNWSPNFQTRFNLNLRTISFEQPANSSDSIVDSNKFLLGMGVASRLRLSDPLHAEISIGYRKELFVRANSTTQVTLDAVNIPSLGAQFNFDLFSLEPFALGVSGLLETKFSVNTGYYSVRQGVLYGGKIYLEQKDSGFQTELGFSHRAQDSSIAEQSELRINLGIRFFLEVGHK